MYIKITKREYKGKLIEHAKIVESYRDGKTSRQRIILNLGTIKSEEDRNYYQKILDSMKSGKNEFIKINELKTEDAKQFGITYTTNKLLEKYKIDEILQSELSDNKTKFNIYEIIKALIINRLVRPSSELSAIEWIHKDYSEEMDVKLHQIYRSLDYLIPKKEIIEKRIFENLKNMLNLNLDYAHYDLTSTYFEGKCCEIALYGHSRDHRKDRKQIVIGLIMVDGIPISHEVYEGNTVDKATLKETIQRMKTKLGIKKISIIADRGLITEDNLQNLDDEKYEYVLRVQRRNNSIAEEYLTKKINSKENHYAKDVGLKTTKEKKKEDKEYIRRYILCLDNQTKKDRLNTLKEIKKQKETKLKELQEKYEKSQLNKKGKKMTKESLINQAFKILGKNKRLFHIELTKDNRLDFSFREENYEYEKKIAGKFLLVTNTDKDPTELMKIYKKLQVVENAFDELKNYLDARPVHHWKERRVRAHVFVCYLSFLIESLIERFSKESARVTLRELGRIQIIKLKIKDRIENKLTMQPLMNTSNIFKKLKIRNPLYEIVETQN